MKIIREETIPIIGTTKLVIGDPLYLDAISNNKAVGSMKDLVFSGNIIASPLGVLRIRETENTYKINEDGKEKSFKSIDVEVYQGAEEDMLKTYLDGKYYTDAAKKPKELGCDTASYTIQTKYSYDEIHTGADGQYGYIIPMKTHFGMILKLYFATDIFTFDEVKKRMLALFPERKVA